MSATTTIAETRRGTPSPGAVGRLVLPAALLLIGVLGHFAVPAGPARAVFVLPCLFWIPGRAIAAALGLGAKTSGQFVHMLSVLFSCIALIFAGLLANLVLGHVPLSTLPLWLSGAMVPLNLLERDPVTGLRAALPAVRVAALFTVAFVASAALLWGVARNLPTTRQGGYLSFSLAGQYTKVQGVIQGTAGQRLDIPLAVGGADNPSMTGLTVATYLDGKQTGTLAPVTTAGADAATAQVSVTVPSGTPCLHQFRLILERGTTQLRAVDLYVRTGKGGGCGNG